VRKLSNITKKFEINVKNYNEIFKIISIFDITDYEKFCKDELTGLYNRQIVEETVRKLNEKFICIIFFDIDNFKKINDTYGHLAGDKVLKKVAKTTVNSLRKDDIVIRWGGEEFLVLLNDIDCKETILKIAEKLRTNIQNLKFSEFENGITCSFGVCCGTVESYDSFNSLLDKADKTLYRAKKMGKNISLLCEQ